MLRDEQDRMRLSLGQYEGAVLSRLKSWHSASLAGRLWDKDFTIWSKDEVPEIKDRLGWLDLPHDMRGKLREMTELAREIKDEGMMHVVLLGMGGSSLAPEVFQQTLRNAGDYPALTVCDSTHPSKIRAVESSIDLQRTVFLVSSKSGTTLETISLFRYFYDRVSEITDRPGRQFIAITDPGSPLEEIAGARGFRRTFRASPDVGGRYSALTAFGLVPASLIGADVDGLLDSALEVAGASSPSVKERDNPGLLLGATLGELQQAGRDKLTLVTSPSLEAFPQWLEQLVAESTGKDGRGIVPIANENLGGLRIYQDDRFFVYIALADDPGKETEERLKTLEEAGHPVARIVLRGRTDLGGEMFRWEMATASAGAIMGIHPFNQPDVQLAKDLARRAIEGDVDTSKAQGQTVPAAESARLSRELESLLASTARGDYFAIQAYLNDDVEVDRMLSRLRTGVMHRVRTATTLGYGPRFLHSTGQLHKGGPNTGVFLQLVDSPAEDIPIPETETSFGRLVAAQSMGDYQALLQRDRRALRIDLGGDATRGLAALASAVG
jgi:transaldolase/glucose-6-phosphate isomerase